MKRTKDRKRVDLTKPVERPRMPVSVFVRIFLVGSISVVAAGYAIWRHVTVPRPSMLRPVPAAPPSDILPAPEVVPLSPDDLAHDE